MEQPGLRTIAVYEIEPAIVDGISWGGHMVVQQFPKRKRLSKGWRKHKRRMIRAKRHAILGVNALERESGK